MKYCANCGAQLQDESAFCGKCGHKVGSPVTNRNIPKSPSTKLPYSKLSSLNINKINLNKKKIIYGLGIVTIVIIVMIGFIMLQDKSNRYNDYSSSPSYREKPVEERHNSPSYEYDEDENVSESDNSVDMDEPIACPWCSGQGVTPFGDFCNDCGGSGRMTRRQIGAGIDDYPNQREQRQNGSSSSSTSSSSGEGCRQCRIPGTENVKGNGQCKACSGAGWFNGYDLDRIVCNQCAGKKANGEGDGRCRFCNGTGWR